jgi:hypothetical protein
LRASSVLTDSVYGSKADSYRNPILENIYAPSKVKKWGGDGGCLMPLDKFRKGSMAPEYSQLKRQLEHISKSRAIDDKGRPPKVLLRSEHRSEKGYTLPLARM